MKGLVRGWLACMGRRWRVPAENFGPLGIAAALVGGVIACWAGEINLMKAVSTWDPCLELPPAAPSVPPLQPLPPAVPSVPPLQPLPPPSVPPLQPLTPSPPEPARCPWKKSIWLGVALKMAFVWLLIPALAMRAYQRRGERHSRPLVTRRFFLASGGLTVFLLGASITWVASIPLTLSSMNSALYQLYTPFTYVFSILLLREGISVSKTIGVIVAVGSVLLIILQAAGNAKDEPAVDGEMLGDLLVVASAALYAMKGVVYKRWVAMPEEQEAIKHSDRDGGGGHRNSDGDGEHSIDGNVGSAAAASSCATETPICDAAVAVGLMGVWSCVVGPAVLLVADVSGVEPFSWPPLPMVGGYVLVAAMMSLYMFLLYGALAYSTPTFVSVCSLFVTPVTLIWDVAAGRTAAISPVALIGMALLLSSLLLVIFHKEGDAWLRRRLRTVSIALGCRPTAPLLGSLSVTGVDSSSMEPDGRASDVCPAAGTTSYAVAEPAEQGRSQPPPTCTGTAIEQPQRPQPTTRARQMRN